ncbi:Syntaxin-52 [Drechslerella dactyloides]|uniref:SNARE Protein Vam7 n=1 Tax=Drechslerella dactyloides TaxID=74499 RepID=VAM7_DREDA|nr:Syntaxin-52 [Drechslerella dactyloides]WCL15235.1 Vam7 [Drechslerella dactyloides]
MNEPQLLIPSYSTEELPKPHTVYNVSIRLPLRSFSLKKRYSDFDQLHRDLTSSTGVAPPVGLPPKTYFKSTVSDGSFAEQRRKGLEEYLHAIQGSQDPRWRESPPWRQFLNLPSSTSNYDASTTSLSSHLTSLNHSTLADPVLWLDAHREMKTLLQDARSEISRRDQSLSVADQHDAAAAAKKSLVKVSSLLESLEKGLASATKIPSNSGLGDGEVRRRRDLLVSGFKERDALEVLVNSLSTKKLQGETGNGGATSGASKFALGSSRARTTGRVLGAPIPETDRTRQLDNSGVLQLQQQIMKSQDEDLEALLKTVGRQKQMGIEIGQELDEQNKFLDSFDADVERVDDKVRVVKKRLQKIS